MSAYLLPGGSGTTSDLPVSRLGLTIRINTPFGKPRCKRLWGSFACHEYLWVRPAEGA